MTNTALKAYAQEHGGRVSLLFLLFLLAIYEFITAGFNAFAIISISPLIILAVYIAFNWQMSTFWLLVLINYFLQCFNKNQILPGAIPMSMYNELLEIILMCIAIVDVRQSQHFERIGNLMLLSLITWCGFCTLEVLNDTCNLGINIGAWYQGARMMAFQLLYAYIVFMLYITTPQRLIAYLRIWALLCLFSVFWTWKQINMGPTHYEQLWLWNAGAATHVLNGGSLIRWFSTHNDAANYGVNAAASAVVFFVMSITTKIKYDRIFYAIVSILITWGMFQSGTRTAIFCLIAGFMVFLVLSKSFKIMVPSAIVGAIFLFILIFTDLGNGNQQIRRMRSAFDKNDASSGVRAMNQAVMKKYLKDAPWGIGIGMGYDNVPSNNKYRIMATIPPDSEYVFIWLRTGVIGITFFLITTVLMFWGACYIVFFKIKNRTLMGIGAGLCGHFVAMQLGGYGNQVLMQFPNALITYGGLTIVYALPYIQSEWIELENKRFEQQEEKKRLKLEKRKRSRITTLFKWI